MLLQLDQISVWRSLWSSLTAALMFQVHEKPGRGTTSDERFVYRCQAIPRTPRRIRFQERHREKINESNLPLPWILIMAKPISFLISFYCPVQIGTRSPLSPSFDTKFATSPDTFVFVRVVSVKNASLSWCIFDHLNLWRWEYDASFSSLGESKWKRSK